MRRNEKVTYDEIRRLFTYNPNTGLFINKTTRNNNALAGCEAGCADKDGYINLSIMGLRYKAHRLVFLYMDGYIPEDGLDVDHINRVTNDNRYSNLRVVSRSCNLRNTGKSVCNTSGVKGVVFDSSRNKWSARIKVLSKEKNLGRFCNFKDAVMVRYREEMLLGYSNCNMSTSAYKYIVANNLVKDPDNIDEIDIYIRNISKSIRANSKTGISGVTLEKKTGRYTVKVTVGREIHYLGCYKELYKAVISRYKGELKYDFDSTYSNSSAYNYLKDNNYITSEWERV